MASLGLLTGYLSGSRNIRDNRSVSYFLLVDGLQRLQYETLVYQLYVPGLQTQFNGKLVYQLRHLPRPVALKVQRFTRLIIFEDYLHSGRLGVEYNNMASRCQKPEERVSSFEGLT